jgi:RNA polymerase sigma factor (TIGR02999 family)
MSEVTRLLEALDRGEPTAAEELLPLVYEELRRLAHQKMASQPPGQTIQATALVHEAYLKLARAEAHRWQGRRHFYAAAAEAMRRILIDRARRKLRLRRGAGAERVDLDQVELAAPAKEEALVQLDEALIELAEAAPELAEVVKLRFFSGLSEAEVAKVLQSSERTVQRQWAHARALLFDRIESIKAE